MAKLAVLILAGNEEINIGDCVKSASFADEVIVIHSGGTDKTVQIAEKCGAKVVYHPMTEGFAAQRNFALTTTQAEWVMYLDADERISAKLAAEIVNCVESGEQAAYEMPRQNISFGKWLRYGGWYPDYCLRLYPRSAVSWEGIVHEKVNFTIPKRRLDSPLIHYTYYDWDRYFAKFNSYTTLMAKRLHERGKKANMFHIILRPLWAFFRVYILKAGWRDGKMGFIMAVLHSFYTMVKYLKLYYLMDNAEDKFKNFRMENKKDKESIRFMP